MKIRYQVFLSSTFRDLQDERRKVFDVLMKMNCIPAGMELFPAADDEQFDFIKRVIDDCDYYVLIIGGRYGSVSNDGVSYTEKEYHYAVSKGIKVITFLHEEPQKLSVEKTDLDSELVEKLEKFRILVGRGRLVQSWSSADDLASKVILGLHNAISTYPAIGWVRADNVPDESSAQETLKLKDELEKLKRSVEASRNKPPEGTDDLAQGDEYLPLDYRLAFRINNTFRTEKSGWLKVDMTWNQIFSAIAPSLMHEASLKELQNKLEIAVGLRQGEIIAKIAAEHSSEEKKLDYDSTEIWSMGFDTVVVQLKALGLIQQSQRIRSLKDQKTYWSLTPFGDSQMTRLRAVKKLNLTLSA